MSAVTEQHERQYQEQGFFVLPGVMPDEHLALLRDQCEVFINKIHREMDEVKSDNLGANFRGNRYFIANRYKESPPMKKFIFSDLMADICRATIGPDAW